jgi:hypothetical protein
MIVIHRNGEPAVFNGHENQFYSQSAAREFLAAFFIELHYRYSGDGLAQKGIDKGWHLEGDEEAPPPSEVLLPEAPPETPVETEAPDAVIVESDAAAPVE